MMNAVGFVSRTQQLTQSFADIVCEVSAGKTAEHWIVFK
jgi:hypothetical protein